MLSRRGDKEMFDLCVSESASNTSGSESVSKAVSDVCKQYKIGLFDKYYEEASRAFKYPIMDTESRKKVDLYIDRMGNQYKGIEW